MSGPAAPRGSVEIVRYRARRRASDARMVDLLKGIRRHAIHGLRGSQHTRAELEAWAAALAEQDATQPWFDSATFLAVRATEITGFGQIQLRRGHIGALYVLPEEAGKGHGRALMSAMEAASLAAGRDCLYLSASLNAVGFYEKCGYEVVASVEQRTADGPPLSFRMMRRALPTREAVCQVALAKRGGCLGSRAEAR